MIFSDSSVHCKPEDGYPYYVFIAGVQTLQSVAYANLYSPVSGIYGVLKIDTDEIPSELEFILFDEHGNKIDVFPEELRIWISEFPKRCRSIENKNNWQALRTSWNDYKETGCFENLYFVIRKAEGNRFEESSYAKVVKGEELVFLNRSKAFYRDELVFIQNYGNKEICEKLKNGCNFELNHFGIGKEW